MSTTSTDRVVRLQTLPVMVNASEIADAIVEWLTPDERLALKHGMLPSLQLQNLRSALEMQFRRIGVQQALSGDMRVALIESPECDEQELVHFRMGDLVSEAIHHVELALYDAGRKLQKAALD